MKWRRAITAFAVFAAGFFCLRGCSDRRTGPPLFRFDVQQAYPERPTSELEGLPATSERDVARTSALHDSFDTGAAAVACPVMVIRATDAVMRTPIPGLTTLTSLYAERAGDAGPTAEGRTDASGKLQVALEPCPELVHVEVRSPITNALLASWCGPPRPELELCIPSLQFVFGELRTKTSLPAAASNQLRAAVNARTPAGDIYLGEGPVGPDGKFRVPVYPSRELSELVIDLVDAGQPIARTFSAVDVATVFPGVRFDLDLSVLDVRVQSSGGAPVPRAAVAIEFNPELDRPGIVLRAETDEGGGCSLVLPNGRGRLCAWHAGYDAAVESLEIPTSELVVMLEPADASRRITVQTQTSGGEAIEGALITFRSTESVGLGAAAMVQVRTDARGRAAIACPRGGPGTLVAFHPKHGLAGPIRIDAVAGASFVLIMEVAGELHVDLQVSADDQDLARGLIAWCVVDLARKRSWSESWIGPPYAVQFLPQGDFVVFVCYVETGLFGMERVAFTDAPGQVVTIPVRPGFSLSGQVRSQNSASLGGLDVVLDVPGILPDIAERFCRARVQASGQFQAFAGDALLAGVRLRRRGSVVWAGSAEVAGEHIITLDP